MPETSNSHEENSPQEQRDALITAGFQIVCMTNVKIDLRNKTYINDVISELKKEDKVCETVEDGNEVEVWSKERTAEELETMGYHLSFEVDTTIKEGADQYDNAVENAKQSGKKYSARRRGRIAELWEKTA